MSNADTPAENTGGNPAAPTTGPLANLPGRIRVHALAKLLESNSRELLGTLSELGEATRSAQSSVPREVALRAAAALGRLDAHSEPAEPAEPAAVPSSAEVTSAQATSSERVSEQSGQSLGEPTPAGEPTVTPERTPVLAAPSPVFLPPAPAKAAPRTIESEPAADTEPDAASTSGEAEGASNDEAEGDDDTDSVGRRRRRRGRRGRGRGKGGEDGSAESSGAGESKPGGSSDESANSGQPSVADDEQSTTVDASSAGGDDGSEDADHADGADSESASKRRRRRRRRKGNTDEESATRGESGGSSDSDTGDPPDTVVHVRETKAEQDKSGKDGVRSVRGSTRLEAKRQRRRDGRDAGRRRAPILSESEFLARRESVERTMVVAEKNNATQIGVLEDGVLVEHFVTSAGSGSIVGNVYLGRVQNVLPSMEAAFVDIGRGRNAVLYAGEVDWDAAGLEGKSRKIEQALATGDSVLVQVTKDPVGHKGARLSTQISLAGRFLVYVPAGGATGISRKLPENERRRLKDILKRVVPGDAGVIIRTASEGISEEELGEDVRRLQAQWEVIKEKSESAATSSGKSKKSNAPTILYEEPDLLVKVVRDLFTEDFVKLEVQGDGAWETIKAYVEDVAPDLRDRLKCYTGSGDVFVDNRIDEQITKALDRKVWLPSGGYLVIDRTEAMSVIDVNTGKFTGSGGNLEETVTRNNLEAAEEIVRQLRLRDIGGIIVIDFIDMVLESNRDLVLRRLTECLGRDRTRHQVAEVTSLGLVQMTRKRVGTGLLEAFSTSCEHCKGRGVLVSSEPNRGGNGGGGGTGGHQHGGSRRSRGKNKGDDSRGSGRAEPASAGPTPQQRESVATAVQAMANASKVATAKQGDEPESTSTPSAQGDEHQSHESNRDARHDQPDEAAGTGPSDQPSGVGQQRTEHGGGAESVVEPKSGQSEGSVAPAPDRAAAAGGANHDSQPSEQTDPAGGSAPAQGAAEEQEVNVPAPAVGTTDRRPRRAASRPAGPPVSASEGS